MDATLQLIQLYASVRSKTEALCLPLATEDYVIQSVDDVSPPKWHLAHTTWFFETFILSTHQPNYAVFNPSFHHLFNSYYHSIGQPYPRMRRGHLSRPTVETIYAYRHYVDQKITEYLTRLSDVDMQKIKPILILGLNHEQQHQELLLMDIKHNFSYDPSFISYATNVKAIHSSRANETGFFEVDGGLIEVGHSGTDFCFDNELPRHAYHLKPYKMAMQLVTNGEFCEFIEAGGYKKPDAWLADGWECIQKNQWNAPLYWLQRDGKWYVFTLAGLEPLNLNDPVTHVSFYEADAYARFRGLRLPTEMEWEHVVSNEPRTAVAGHFLESEYFHPRACVHEPSPLPQQLLGDVWEWTMSPYSPYPGYQPTGGALGEYNGKFMSNQMVLRGGSCVTPASHMRPTYRNFFQPDKRWQFSGIRLASHL